MTLLIRAYQPADAPALIALWRAAGLTRPWNDPALDIQRKQAVQLDLFLVGELAGGLVASAMAGYDGHRGAVYYLGVLPSQQRHGHARAMMRAVETRLHALGCPKLNVMLRADNRQALEFYARLGYVRDPVVVASKRLIEDGSGRPAHQEGKL